MSCYLLYSNSNTPQRQEQAAQDNTAKYETQTDAGKTPVLVDSWETVADDQEALEEQEALMTGESGRYVHIGSADQGAGVEGRYESAPASLTLGCGSAEQQQAILRQLSAMASDEDDDNNDDDDDDNDGEEELEEGNMTASREKQQQQQQQQQRTPLFQQHGHYDEVEDYSRFGGGEGGKQVWEWRKSVPLSSYASSCPHSSSCSSSGESARC